MMRIEQLIALVERAVGSGVDVSERHESGLSVIVSRAAEAGAGMDSGPADGVAATVADTIISAMYGQLHLYAEPGSDPFVSLGDMVEAGQRVALVEAMKTFCPVLAHRAGRIVEIVLRHGAEVSLGQPLFRVA